VADGRIQGAATAPAAATAGRRAPTHPLTGRIHAGDAGAFATFYELWFDRLLAMARTTTRRDEAFCLDVVQDCMVRVVDKITALASEEAVATWLARTLLRGAVDRLRADARRGRRESAAAAQQPAMAASSDQAAADDEQRQWLAARLAELPAADRELLLARFHDGATLDAVGSRFGMSGDAAHGRIRRLVLRLKDAAKGAFDDRTR
jgi:RNA polymerase sigma factor (sigma-70 family)